MQPITKQTSGHFLNCTLQGWPRSGTIGPTGAKPIPDLILDLAWGLKPRSAPDEVHGPHRPKQVEHLRAQRVVPPAILDPRTPLAAVPARFGSPLGVSVAARSGQGPARRHGRMPCVPCAMFRPPFRAPASRTGTPLERGASLAEVQHVEVLTGDVLVEDLHTFLKHKRNRMLSHTQAESNGRRHEAPRQRCK